MENWKEVDDENDRFFERQMEQAKAKNSADRDYFGAAQVAKRGSKADDLMPYRDEHGEFRYTVQQGLKASCHAREDVCAILVIQQSVLARLDRNRNLLWVAIGLLLYLAVRLS